MESLLHFLINVCGVPTNWNMEDVLEEQVQHVRSMVGPDEHVICGLSGVDSTVASMLVHKAIGDRLHCLFVDNGLLRVECENPKVWSQICIQKLAELAKESTTMRRILDPMFTYFHMHKHWAPKHGLALNVLLNMACLSKISGNEQFILIALVRHLDNKDIIHDPQLKSNIVQIATSLVKQLRLQSVVIEIGVVSILCRHLRKSLQVTVDIVRPEESSWNFLLQDSIEDCLLEIVKGIRDASPLYDMMTITLQKLASVAIVARSYNFFVICSLTFRTNISRGTLVAAS